MNITDSTIAAREGLYAKHSDPSLEKKYRDRVPEKKQPGDYVDLSVSAKMTSKLNGLREALYNIDRGRAMVKTADNALAETESILQRLRRLAVKSSNGTYSANDRQKIMVEVSALVDEIDRVASQTEYNRFLLLQGDFSKYQPKASMWIHVGPHMHQRERIFIQTMTARGLGLREGAGRFVVNLSTASAANRSIGLLDAALHRLSKMRSDLAGYDQRLKETGQGTVKSIEHMLKSEDVRVDREELIDVLKTVKKRNNFK